MCNSRNIKQRKLFFYGSETMKKQLTPAWMLMYGYFFKSFSFKQIGYLFWTQKIGHTFYKISIDGRRSGNHRTKRHNKTIA